MASRQAGRQGDRFEGGREGGREGRGEKSDSCWREDVETTLHFLVSWSLPSHSQLGTRWSWLMSHVRRGTYNKMLGRSHHKPCARSHQRRRYSGGLVPHPEQERARETDAGLVGRQRGPCHDLSVSTYACLFTTITMYRAGKRGSLLLLPPWSSAVRRWSP